MKIVSVVGARPQFIKYSPLSRRLRKEHRDILVHTGQHYDENMNQIFFDELAIPEPDYNLGVGSGTHAFQTGEMLKGIENILLKEKPDMAMVYGDTNSTLAGALAAAKLHIRVAHVEAGLRLYDKTIPEEINRALTDHCSDLLFCPTPSSVDNLRKENLVNGVYLTGDVMVDALVLNRDIAERSKILDEIGVKNKQYLFVTVHRQGNTDVEKNLSDIAGALIRLGGSGETVVFSVHPRTRKMLEKFGLFDRLQEKIRLIEPVGYLESLKLLSHAKRVLTDSGGVQKEAYILETPCVTLMADSPWMETVNDGWNVLAGTDPENVFNLGQNFSPQHGPSHVFGQGACENIAGILRLTSG